jgi:serine protease Do
VYSNAHFVPVDESTSPPRYYRPSGRGTGKKTEEHGSDRKRVWPGFFAILALCFLCGVIGGVLGAFALMRYSRPAETESALPESAGEEILAADESGAYGASSSNGWEGDRALSEPDTLSAAEVYDLACRQVVNVSVELMTYDVFGNQTPSVVSGSGFFISEDGYILTNYHVVEKAVKNGLNVTVSTHDASVYVGKIVGTEEDEDLAVIKIDQDGLEPVVFGDSDSMNVGDSVYAVGNPYGMLEFTMTTGHISALNRQIAAEETETALRMFQIDAAVYSGNSGGPVYDTRGRVVGVVTAKYASSSGMEGIGFALPINDVVPVVSELVDKGYVSGKASLGVSFDNRYNTVYSRYYRLPEGAFVSSVEKGSCAEAAGILPGDILMQIGEYHIEDYADVPSALRHFSAGDTTEVSVYREAQILTLSVCFDEAVPSLPQNTSRLTYYSFYRNY